LHHHAIHLTSSLGGPPEAHIDRHPIASAKLAGYPRLPAATWRWHSTSTALRVSRKLSGYGCVPSRLRDEMFGGAMMPEQYSFMQQLWEN
jgi:hypothetical protein